MKYTFIASLLLIMVSFSGCYHAKVVTGKEPSAKVYTKPFASSFIYGLVPPSTVKAAEECSNGAAIIETKLSFVNMLVGDITFGLYTPMNIKVTCAASSASLEKPLGPESNAQQNYMAVSKNSSEQDVAHAIQKASDLSAKTGQAVQLQFK